MTQLSAAASMQTADWPLPPGLTAVAVRVPPDGKGPGWADLLDREGLDEFDLNLGVKRYRPLWRPGKVKVLIGGGVSSRDPADDTLGRKRRRESGI